MGPDHKPKDTRAGLPEGIRPPSTSGFRTATFTPNSRKQEIPSPPPRAIESTPAQASERQVATPRLAEGSAREESPVKGQRAAAVSEYVSVAAKSPSIWSGAGAAVFCIESSLLAVAGHLVVGWKTLRNEVQLRRQHQAQKAPAAPNREIHAPERHAGYRGLLSDALRSPAFNSLATGACYLAASAQCLLRGQLFEGAVLATYFAGMMAMSNTISSSYTGTRTTQTLPERAFRWAWSALPDRLQDFLKNPSVWLAAGNLPLVAVTCNLAKIATNPVVTAPAAVGLLLSEFGLVSALHTLVRGPKTESHGADATGVDPMAAKRAAAASFATGMILNAAGHLLVGASSLMQDAPYIGSAKICWCIACGLLGFQLRKQARATGQELSAPTSVS